MGNSLTFYYEKVITTTTTTTATADSKKTIATIETTKSAEDQFYNDLYGSIINNNIDKVERVLESNVRYDINVYRSYGAFKENLTPLHFAVQQGRLKAVRLLLEYGADDNLKTTNDKTVKEIATSQFVIELLANETLLKQIKGIKMYKFILQGEYQKIQLDRLTCYRQGHNYVDLNYLISNKREISV